jgi:hypothetical protein
MWATSGLVVPLLYREGERLATCTRPLRAMTNDTTCIFRQNILYLNLDLSLPSNRYLNFLKETTQ